MRTIAKRAVQGVVAGALALTGIAATSGTASALTAGNEYVFRNQNTGRCLDDSGDGNHDLMRGYPCNGSSQDGGWQGWTLW
ncbi:hypothetical protein GCM10010441_13090 [Kitasatospora paracochleata]|uniref:Ricin B lectin domain-containing protein n=1 Tax=Kitasatospora paracochleata TaxID=58354 RepID=A0ABT1JCZ8_9ACTN|nr:hypothetical protein [Kitasatospora paracochleata]MCP2314591.1 hypothetical protein [Kitasatospora paracochleata]